MGLLGGFKGKLKGKEKPPKPEGADVVCVKYNKVFSEFDSPASAQPSTSSTNNHPKVRRTDGATPHNRLSRMPTTIMRPEMKTMFEKLQNELAEKSTPPPPRPPTPTTASTPQNGAIPKTKSSTATNNNRTEPKAKAEVPQKPQKPTEAKKLDSKKIDNKKEKTVEKKKDASKNKKEAAPQKPDDKALKTQKETAAKLEAAQKKAELKLKKNEKSKEKSSKHLTPTKNKMAAPKSPMIDRTVINTNGGSVETSFKTVNKAKSKPSSSATANELLPPPLPQQPPPYSETAMARTKENWNLATHDTAEDEDGNFKIQIAATRKTNDDDSLYATANADDDDGGNFKIHFANHAASSGNQTSSQHLSDEDRQSGSDYDDEGFLHENDLSPVNYSSHATNIFFGGTDEEPVVVRPRNIAMTKSKGDGDDESYGSSASA